MPVKKKRGHPAIGWHGQRSSTELGRYVFRQELIGFARQVREPPPNATLFLDAPEQVLFVDQDRGHVGGSRDAANGLLADIDLLQIFTRTCAQAEVDRHAIGRYSLLRSVLTHLHLSRKFAR